MSHSRGHLHPQHQHQAQSVVISGAEMSSEGECEEEVEENPFPFDGQHMEAILCSVENEDSERENSMEPVIEEDNLVEAELEVAASEEVSEESEAEDKGMVVDENENLDSQDNSDADNDQSSNSNADSGSEEAGDRLVVDQNQLNSNNNSSSPGAVNIEPQSESVTVKSETTEEQNSDPNNEVKQESKQVKGAASTQQPAPNDAWAHFTGLKVKQFTTSELEAFKRPFESGWKREVVLRGTVTNSGKKIGDVYYFSPDKKVKLRSYVEMGLYLKKHPDCGLEPENFTFARQPIYKSPEEVVRHAMQRGGSYQNQISPGPTGPAVSPAKTPATPKTPRNTEKQERSKSIVSASDSGADESQAVGVTSVAGGRAKRKRVAPTRFEDEDYSEQSPFKKKTVKTEKGATPSPVVASVKLQPQQRLQTQSLPLPPAPQPPQPPQSQTQAQAQPQPQLQPSLAPPLPPTAVAAPPPPPQLPLPPPPQAQAQVQPQVQPQVKPVQVNAPAKVSLLAHPTVLPKKLQPHGQTLLQSHGHLIVSGIQPLQQIHAQRQTMLQQQQASQKASVTESQGEKQQLQTHLHSQEDQHQTDLKDPGLLVNGSNSGAQVNLLETSSGNGTASLLQQTSARKSASFGPSSGNKHSGLRIKLGGFKPIKPKPSADTDSFLRDDQQDDAGDEGQANHSGQPVAPCSIMCGGRRGTLPSLLCSRCLLLFHPECVSNGIYLRDPHQFVCPNCIQPGDRDKSPLQSTPVAAVNGSETRESDQCSLIETPRPAKALHNKSASNSAPNSAATGSSPLMVQSVPIAKGGQLSRSYPPILPKPAPSQPPPTQQQQSQHQLASQQNQHQSQLHLIQHYQHQQQLKQQHHQQLQHQPQPTQKKSQHSSPYSTMNVKLPAGTQLYRVPTSGGGQNSLGGNKKQASGKSNASSVPNAVNHNHKGARKSVSHMASGSRLLEQQTKALINCLHPLQGSVPYQPPPIAPIGPIKITPAQIASFLDRRKHRRGYREYMTKAKPGINKLTGPNDCLNTVFQYLNVGDLVNLKQVNRTFNRLASQPFLWQKVKLKGVSVKDWQFLGRNIIEPYTSFEIDFQGLRCPTGTDLCDLWRNFSSIIDYLKSVKHLRFGMIPTFVVEEIQNAAATENCYNSFSSLESLTIKNLFEEETDLKQCRLHFMEQMKYLPQLQSLHINCKHGFVGDPDVCNLLTETFASLPNLRCLVLPNLKGLNAEQFSFLGQLKALERLELGSCESWMSVAEVDDLSGHCKQEDAEKPAEASVKGATEQPKEELKGAFKHLSHLTQLVHLKLVEVIVDETSNQLPLALQGMERLEYLSLESVTISPDATETLDLLLGVTKSHVIRLKGFFISTDDPHTNKYVFELFKKLDQLEEITWKVGALVEDSGECLVPFIKESVDESDLEGEPLELTNGEDNLEMMEVSFLTQVLQKRLTQTRIKIWPQ